MSLADEYRRQTAWRDFASAMAPLVDLRGQTVLDLGCGMGDLRCLPDLASRADGIWCSFAAAYFPDLAKVLAGWASLLRPGGWILLTEMDDLFGHSPLPGATRALLDAYAEDAIRNSRYHFRMDQELAFDGPADSDVFSAWRDRLAHRPSLPADPP